MILAPAVSARVCGLIPHRHGGGPAPRAVVFTSPARCGGSLSRDVSVKQATVTGAFFALSQHKLDGLVNGLRAHGGPRGDTGVMPVDEATDTARLGLPPIYQVGYVVNSVNDTVDRLDALFGPFNVFDVDMTIDYHNQPTPVQLRIAIGHSGDLEMEYIEVLGGDSPHKAWLEQHGESIMHVAVKVQDVDAELARLGDLGFDTVWYHRMPEIPSIVFAYAQHKGGGHILELTQGF